MMEENENYLGRETIYDFLWESGPIVRKRSLKMKLTRIGVCQTFSLTSNVFNVFQDIQNFMIIIF